MSKSVAQVLEREAVSLFEKLASSGQVANLVMGMVGKLVWECARRGKPIEGVEMGHVTEAMGEFRFHVKYHDLLVSPLGVWQFGGGDLVGYIAGRSVHMAKAVQRNPRILKGIAELVDVIDRFARRKNIPFSEVNFKKAWITREDVFVFVSGAQTLDRWGR